VDNSELVTEVVTSATEGQSGSRDDAQPLRKRFVAPEISVPVDVLEATTFFQALASGPVNP
jgi:hypothetical protein